ncbi:hypothetical protein BDQ17DRAFT_1327352 [Cyathus striatus]|nr:hypothetical protein BDQ17DRAFT_1327352 [Cyathus striatus]
MSKLKIYLATFPDRKKSPYQVVLGTLIFTRCQKGTVVKTISKDRRQLLYMILLLSPVPSLNRLKKTVRLLQVLILEDLHKRIICILSIRNANFKPNISVHKLEEDLLESDYLDGTKEQQYWHEVESFIWVLVWLGARGIELAEELKWH